MHFWTFLQYGVGLVLFVGWIFPTFTLSDGDGVTEWIPSEKYLSSLKETEGDYVRRTVLYSIDHTIDPCNDFYQYACGSRLSHEKVGLSETTHGYLKEELNSYILRNPSTNAFYTSCLKQGNSSASLTTYLLEKINDIERSTNAADIMSIVGTIEREKGMSLFFYKRRFIPNWEGDQLKTSFYFDFGFPNEKRILSLGGVLVSIHRLLTLQDVAKVRDIIRQYLKSSGNDDSSTYHDPYEVSTTYEPSTYNISFLADKFFDTVGPTFKELFKERNDLKNVIIHPDSNIHGLYEMETLLRNESVPNIIKFVKYALVMSYASFQIQGGSLLSGDELKAFCEEKTHHIYFDVIFKDFYRWNQNIETVLKIKEIWENLLQEANLQVQRSSLDQPTQADFAKKINSIRLLIQGENYDSPKPPRAHVNPNKKVEDILTKVKDTNTYIQNLLIAEGESFRNSVHTIGKPIDFNIKEWLFPKAMYFSQSNTGVVLASVLRYPMFDPLYPLVLQYAIVGDLLARVIMQSIDNDGINYNHKGLLRYISYDKVIMYKEIYSRIKCYRDFYTNLNSTKSNFNPKNYFMDDDTLRNFIANSGLQLAYSAYMKTENTSSIPGYTPEKLFFLSYAQRLCSIESFNKDSATSNMWSRSKIQVNGNLMLNPDFSQAFKCSNTSNMNPPNKCSWLG